MISTLSKQAESETLSKTKPFRKQAGLILTNQAGLRRKNPSWKLVEQVIREIDVGHGNSHCCLEAPGDSYIQTLHGFNGYHLEWRVTNGSNYTHYRACYPGASPKLFELKKHDNMNPGEHRDLVHLEDVIDSFRSFYRGEDMPAFFDWRILEI